MKKSPIVILHGWGLSGSKFTELKTVLEAEGHRVYTPDLPGFGTSKIPDRAYYLADYARFLYEFILKHTIREPILLGHSFGGRVTLKFQTMYPSVARAIILTGTPGVTPVPRKKLMLFIIIAKVGKAFVSVWPLRVLQSRIRTWYYYVVGARDFYRAEGVMREIFKHIVQEDLVAAMENIRVPCLLVWGDRDQITPVWIAKKMNSVIAESSLIILPDADHGVSYKKSDVFVKSIRSFLNQV